MQNKSLIIGLFDTLILCETATNGLHVEMQLKKKSVVDGINQTQSQTLVTVIEKKESMYVQVKMFMKSCHDMFKMSNLVIEFMLL